MEPLQKLEEVLPPRPRRPSDPDPQHFADPSVSTAQEWEKPREIFAFTRSTRDRSTRVRIAINREARVSGWTRRRYTLTTVICCTGKVACVVMMVVAEIVAVVHPSNNGAGRDTRTIFLSYWRWVETLQTISRFLIGSHRKLSRKKIRDRLRKLPRFFDRLPRARILTHLTHSRHTCIKVYFLVARRRYIF